MLKNSLKVLVEPYDKKRIKLGINQKNHKNHKSIGK